MSEWLKYGKKKEDNIRIESAEDTDESHDYFRQGSLSYPFTALDAYA